MSVIAFVLTFLFFSVTLFPFGYYLLRAVNLSSQLSYVLLVGLVLSLTMTLFLVGVSEPNKGIIFVRNALWAVLWYLAAVPLPAFISGTKLFKDLCEPGLGGGQMSMDFSPFLTPSPFLDFDYPDVAAKVLELSEGKSSDIEIARACFTFVRDEISHSSDAKQNPVTCKASDVLKHKTGYCYAKSHLLAALLRANKIPAALCYQRLSVDDKGPPFCLHGLNAVYLKDHGWYRCDARGNKPGVDARFDPPNEHLAFALKLEGERDLSDRYAEPLPEVVAALTIFKTWDALLENLPDAE